MIESLMSQMMCRCTFPETRVNTQIYWCRNVLLFLFILFQREEVKSCIYSHSKVQLIVFLFKLFHRCLHKLRMGTYIYGDIVGKGILYLLL